MEDLEFLSSRVRDRMLAQLFRVSIHKEAQLGENSKAYVLRPNDKVVMAAVSSNCSAVKTIGRGKNQCLR